MDHTIIIEAALTVGPNSQAEIDILQVLVQVGFPQRFPRHFVYKTNADRK